MLFRSDCTFGSITGDNMPRANLVCLIYIAIFYQSRNSIIMLFPLLIHTFYSSSQPRHTCLQLTKEWFFRISTTPSRASRSAMNCSNVGCGTLWIIFQDSVNFVLLPRGTQKTCRRGIFKYLGVHSFIRKTSDIVARQTRDEIDPVCIISLRT